MPEPAGQQLELLWADPAPPATPEPVREAAPAATPDRVSPSASLPTPPSPLLPDGDSVISATGASDILSPQLRAGEDSRHIALSDRIVPYILRRARRRTIGLSIDHRGLRVGAPTRASLREIESLIRRHEAWVVEKLDEWRGRRRPEKLRVVDGLSLPLLGGELRVALAPLSSGSRARAVWSATGLTLCLPGGSSEAAARALLEKALRERARELFAERLRHYGALLELTPPPLSLSAARTRWGSCSRSGIRLNWRLLHFSPALVDYVVAHELAHLIEMNHSPRFWAVVERLYPDYRTARQQLREAAATCPLW